MSRTVDPSAAVFIICCCYFQQLQKLLLQAAFITWKFPPIRLGADQPGTVLLAQSLPPSQLTQALTWWSSYLMERK